MAGTCDALGKMQAEPTASSIRISALGTLLVILLIAGCAVGPDYKRPEATRIPPAYAGATNGWKVSEPRAHIPKGSWWEMFQDPELNRLETEAAAANQQLKAAFARLEQAHAITDVTRDGLF